VYERGRRRGRELTPWLGAAWGLWVGEGGLRCCRWPAGRARGVEGPPARARSPRRALLSLSFSVVGRRRHHLLDHHPLPSFSHPDGRPSTDFIDPAAAAAGRRRPAAISPVARTPSGSACRRRWSKWRPTCPVAPERPSRSSFGCKRRSAAAAAWSGSSRRSRRTLFERSSVAAAGRRRWPPARQLRRPAHDDGDDRRTLFVAILLLRRPCQRRSRSSRQAHSEPLVQNLLGDVDADRQSSTTAAADLALRPLLSRHRRRPSSAATSSARRGRLARHSTHLQPLARALCRLLDLLWLYPPRSADMVLRARAERSRADQGDARERGDDVLLGRLSPQVHQGVG